jgi:hypothetical protein
MSSATSFREFPEKEQLQDLQAALVRTLAKTVPLLKSQLELLDDVDISESQPSSSNSVKLGRSDNGSLLYSLATRVEDLDACYLQNKLKGLDFDKFLAKMQRIGNVDIRDGLIFTRTGARKTDIRTSGIRRLSFAATTFNDTSAFINKNKLLEMTDLQYLFYLNAYYVPYLGLSEGRSMYQTFFGVAVSNLLEGDDLQSPAGFGFHVLQEAIYPIQMVTEYTVSLIECILEIVTVINTRIRTSATSIEQRLDLSMLKDPALEHILECFNSGDKVYASFKKRKILSAIRETDAVSPKSDRSPERMSLPRVGSGNEVNLREREKQVINWRSKIRDYHQALLSAVDAYKIQCEVFLEQLQELKKTAAGFRQIIVHETPAGLRDGSDTTSDDHEAETKMSENQTFETQTPEDRETEKRMTKIEAYLADAFVYVTHFQSFLDALSTPDGVYMKFYASGAAFLDLLHELEEKYPIRYGNVLAPRSKRAGIRNSSDRYGRKSSNSSPRSGANSDNETLSPRSGSGEDNSLRKTPEIEPALKSGETKSMFSRVLGSVFK